MRYGIWRGIFLLFLFLITVALSVSIFADHEKEKAEGVVEALESEGEDLNFLLIGVDKTSYSSDVIMLCRMRQNELSFVQIPRDSLTASGNRLNATFAAAYSRAKNEGKSDREAYLSGGEALSDKLAGALGISIKAHATVTLSALRLLIDEMGGVDVVLDTPLSYEDPAQGLVISLEAGACHLDGASAEGLVRCRNAYPDADYGRMRAQRKLITAVFQKLSGSFSPLFLFSLFRKAYGEVATSLSFADALVLMKRVFGKRTELFFATLCRW